MRVAIFSDSYFPQINGVVTQIKNLSEELISRGHHVLVVAPSSDRKFQKKKRGNVEEIYLPSVALPTYSDYRIMLPHSSMVLRALKEFAPDVIHVQTPFGAGWLGIRAGKKLHVPVVGTYHTLLPEFMMYLPVPVLNKSAIAKRAAWKYTNLFYNKCDLVTTPTESMARELARNGVKGAVVLPNAINFPEFNRRAKKRVPSKNPKLIYFGRISYEKNIEVLIFALKHLLWLGQKVSLTITGSGPALNYLKGIVRAEKLSVHVHFHNALPQDELARHVATHDIFVTASTIETQGLTILEAMAAGLPCIGADCLAIPDSIREGRNGFLFRPYDFVELARKAERLIDSAKLRKKLGANAVETAREYSVERIATLNEKLYTGAIEGKNNS